MKKGTRFALSILFSLGFCMFPGVSHAATLPWGEITIQDGGSYPVHLNTPATAQVTLPPPAYQPHGVLYFLSTPGDESSRQYLSDITYSGTSFSFTQAGEYEVDVYKNEFPSFEEIRSPSPLHIFAWFFATPAYAQATGQFVETIHFTITDADAPVYEECCSSVLFLPGLKGSVLSIGSDTLWPPTIWSDDIPQLALSETGESINPVVVEGVLENFYGTPIYSGFTSFLDGLVEDETIADWEPLPYDWRLSPETIVEDGVTTPTGTLNLIEEIERLAETSQTGKVTLVAHSYGGLVGKALIKELEERNEVDLVDSYVMVGSPQLGTPQAVASILHGDDEGMAGGVVVKAAEARGIAQNMPSAYELLPSTRYFSDVTDPVIHFGPDAQYATELRSVYGESIANYFDFVSFVTADEVPRPVPVFNSLNAAEILDRAFIATAKDSHDILDSYDLPEAIRVVQIAGWGVPTVKGIEYRSHHSSPSYVPITTIEGDKTVVYPSAIASEADETYFFDILRFNQNLSRNAQHKSLLSESPVQDVIRAVLNDESISETSYVLSSKPNPADAGAKLLVSTHSPVILGAYDSNGNFSGIVPGQASSSEFLLIKEDIPGSSFLVFGDSQYLFLPLGGTYRFVIAGTGDGLMTVEVQNFSNDSATDLATYTDIPVLATMQASFTLEGRDVAGVAISVDENNDGIEDASYLSDGEKVSQVVTEDLQQNNPSPSNGPPVAFSITSPGLVQGTSTASSPFLEPIVLSVEVATTTVSTSPTFVPEHQSILLAQETSASHVEDDIEEAIIPVQTTEDTEARWYDAVIEYLKNIFISVVDHLKL